MDSDRLRLLLSNFALSTYTAKVSGVSALADDHSFTELQVFDSLTMMSFVAFLEATLAIEIPVEDIVPENFDSIGRVFAYLARRDLLT